MNVAIWMRPANPGSEAVVKSLCRLLALTLTVLYVLAIAGVAVDLVGWKCLSSPRCLAGRSWLSWLSGRPVGLRLAVLALVPAAAIGLIWRISNRPGRTFEAFRAPDREFSGSRLGTVGQWDAEPLVGRLRSIHVAAAFATLDLTLLLARAASGATITLTVVTGVVLVVCAVLLCTPPLIDRAAGDQRLDRVTRTLRTVAVVLTVVVLAHLATGPPQWHEGHGLPGYETHLAGLFVAQTALLAALGVVLLCRRNRGATPLFGLGALVVAGHRDQPGGGVLRGVGLPGGGLPRSRRADRGGHRDRSASGVHLGDLRLLPGAAGHPDRRRPRHRALPAQSAPSRGGDRRPRLPGRPGRGRAATAAGPGRDRPGSLHRETGAAGRALRLSHRTRHGNHHRRPAGAVPGRRHRAEPRSARGLGHLRHRVRQLGDRGDHPRPARRGHLRLPDRAVPSAHRCPLGPRHLLASGRPPVRAALLFRAGRAGAGPPHHVPRRARRRGAAHRAQPRLGPARRDGAPVAAARRRSGRSAHPRVTAAPPLRAALPRVRRRRGAARDRPPGWLAVGEPVE